MAVRSSPASLSTRHYRQGLEPIAARPGQAATSTSRSAVSRQFVAATETALAQLLAADLSGLDLVALMVDGVHFGEHTCVAALVVPLNGSLFSPPEAQPVDPLLRGDAATGRESR